MYDKILLPHGGTSAGDEALTHAIHIAKLDNSKIIILRVIEPWFDPSFGYWQGSESLARDQIEEIYSNVTDDVRKFLSERVARCKKEGIECDGIFKTGKASDSIIKYASEEKIDLIVMPKKRKVPNYKSIFKIGSVTRKVQEKVTCPILLTDTDDD